MDKLKRMDISHGLALLVALTAMLCFLLAGFSEDDFSLWIDGAGVSFILYGLVRAAGWLFSGLELAEEDAEVPKSPQEPALGSNFQERFKQLLGRLTGRTPLQS